MHKITITSITAALFAAAFFTTAACSSSSTDCSAKACPNDPDPTQAQIDACKQNQGKQDKCSSQCGSYVSCLTSHKSDICTNGKTDATKLPMLIQTCPPSADCTKCLSGM